jgi:hypothetical protein
MARQELGAKSLSQYFGGWSNFTGAIVLGLSLAAFERLAATLKRCGIAVNAMGAQGSTGLREARGAACYEGRKASRWISLYTSRRP